jgi:myosin heavy subunit
VEYITDLLAPTIAQTETWTTDEIVEQLKATFNDDEEIANFKGALDEKIKQLQVDEQVVIEKAKPKVEQPLEEKPAPEAEGQALAEEQQVRASKIAVKKLISKIEATKSDIRKISTYVDNVSKETVELRQRNSSLKEQTEALSVANDKLVKERSARLRLPKAKILAQKMTEIGIKTEVKDIMMYRDDEFQKKEAEVEQIWKTVGHREPRFANENLIGGSLPRITGVPVIEEKRSGFTSRAPEGA